jgi:cholesterol transport system auxiliary component
MMSLKRPPRRAFTSLLACVGAAALVAACSSSSSVTNYDLTAPRQVRAGSTALGQIAVGEPAAVQPLESDRIVVREASGAVSSVPGGQWADRLPRLVQSRLIQTFENSSGLKAVSRPGSGVTPDYQLTSELRAFQIDAAAGQAVVEMSIKLVHDRSGRIATTRIFAGRVPVGKVDATNAVQALDRALGIVLLDIVRYVGSARAADAPAT